MKDKKKLIIATSIILGVLVVTFGITYSIFTFNQTGDNSQLVLGDIWMKYTENNQLMLSDAMPMNINNYTTYKVNPVMQGQSVDYKNELTGCTGYFAAYQFDEGSTAETFCRGTGTAWRGQTFQKALDNWMLDDETYFEFLSSNNIIIQDGERYIVNPVMTTQEVEEMNEITACALFYQGEEYEFDEGSTAESFCKGTGTAWDGATIEVDLDAWTSWAKEEGLDFLDNGGQELLDAGVILPKIENLPYFEFTISGKNTYPKKDIWYEIVLTYGDNHETRTTRIRDNLLRFSLAKVEDESETILLNNESYSNLNNKRIWVETIPANTTSEVNNKYRLYMWISEDTIIGNVNQDYTLEEWNDVFASIKVGVNGDFEEKVVETEGSCFDYDFAKIVNPEMATQDASDTSTELYKCIDIFDGYSSWGEGETAEAFCRGTGTYSGFTFQERLDIQYTFDEDEMSHLVEDNILIDSDKIKLTSYDDSCGNYVVLPKQIDGYDVVGVKCSWYGLGYGAGGLFSEKNVKTLVIQDNLTVISPGAFSNSSLQKVVLPDNVTVIGGNAFSSNLLTTIDIPDSVEMIGEYAFCYNEFKTLTIGSGVTLIGQEAFGKAFGSNANLESVIFKNKTCEEIKNIPKSSVNGTKYFPWLYERSPYYEEGNEADIIGTDGVCSY